MPVAFGQKAEKHGDLVRGDEIDLYGSRFIVTGEKRQGQRYLWAAVKVNGHSGAEYKIPRGATRVRHDPNHPALSLVQGKRAAPGFDQETVRRLVRAVLTNDVGMAQAYATELAAAAV